MKFIANILVLIGFCLATFGAAGFQSPWKSATEVPPFLIQQAVNDRIPGHSIQAELDAIGQATPSVNAENQSVSATIQLDGQDPMTVTVPAVKEGGNVTAALQREFARKKLLEVQALERDPETKAGKKLDDWLDVQLEVGAAWIFAGGIMILLMGGWMRLGSRSSVSSTEIQQEREGLRERIAVVRDRLANLSTQAPDLTNEQMRAVLTELTEGEMYELTSAFEHWTRVLGFADYSRIWASVASGERLTNRAWTMVTDGHGIEGRTEIMLAYQAFDEAFNQCH